MFLDCNGVITNLTYTNGTITNDNYPHYYNTNLLCQWEIRTYQNFILGFQVTDLDTEYYENCTNLSDYVQVSCHLFLVNLQI